MSSVCKDNENFQAKNRADKNDNDFSSQNHPCFVSDSSPFVSTIKDSSNVSSIKNKISSGRFGDRIPCPLDPRHDIFANRLLSHTSKCTKARDAAYEATLPFTLERCNYHCPSSYGQEHIHAKALIDNVKDGLSLSSNASCLPLLHSEKEKRDDSMQPMSDTASTTEHCQITWLTDAYKQSCTFLNIEDKYFLPEVSFPTTKLQIESTQHRINAYSNTGIAVTALLQKYSQNCYGCKEGERKQGEREDNNDTAILMSKSIKGGAPQLQQKNNTIVGSTDLKRKRLQEQWFNSLLCRSLILTATAAASSLDSKILTMGTSAASSLYALENEKINIIMKLIASSSSRLLPLTKFMFPGSKRETSVTCCSSSDSSIFCDSRRPNPNNNGLDQKSPRKKSTSLTPRGSGDDVDNILPLEPVENDYSQLLGFNKNNQKIKACGECMKPSKYESSSFESLGITTICEQNTSLKAGDVKFCQERIIQEAFLSQMISSMNKHEHQNFNILARCITGHLLFDSDVFLSLDQQNSEREKIDAAGPVVVELGAGKAALTRWFCIFESEIQNILKIVKKIAGFSLLQIPDLYALTQELMRPWRFVVVEREKRRNVKEFKNEESRTANQSEKAVIRLRIDIANFDISAFLNYCETGYLEPLTSRRVP